MNKTVRIVVGFLWLTSLVSLSFFSGYKLPSASVPVPFSGGALFLTPLGFFIHFLDPAYADLAKLYFIHSHRESLLNLNLLMVLLPIHSCLALLLLFKRRKS